MALEHADLTESIIGAGIEVHRTLGPGFLEKVYENALVHEMAKRGLRCRQQIPVTIQYDGIDVGRHQLDLLVEGLIVVELKAIREFEDIHFAITRSYLRSVNLEHGLLINFGRLKLDVRRVGIRAS